MKKIINAPQDVLTEMVAGLVSAYSDKIEQIPETFAVKRKENAQQVALVSGGGSGHEPAHAGFVGDGMLSAAVCGQVFTSPTPDQIYAAIEATNEGKGVLLIVKNYSGDVMNFEMAQDMADIEDIPVGFVLVDDDIAVEDSTYTQGRRGVAGTILVHKILGAWARNGATVEQLEKAGKELVPKIKTIGVALSGATVPEVGKPGFELAEDEIEFGVGIHGEPGYRREKIRSSKEMAKEIVDKLKAEFKWEKGDTYGVLVNGMGATPLMEQYVFYNDVKALLDSEGITITFSKVGNYMTSIDMAGLSLTMIQTDQAIVEALEAPVDTIAW
ncbi:dihydroxyacetone kinase subunit DhaK [Enterococcus sp. JM4C]|uniref:dihydroxyacetone kinase subunit DhaK n=1 Tax=Candidatus Enterococcus huntleyi TaxID=1857217 RepID=UPI00137AB303|nr:dihydroxyacetone kinase subunit DhaK [Enterococcus sp. JM4C]KAF1295574.1 dihydroxyacetone kinase subunit DhaK [Enterococcus sp. JM4C]